MNREQIVEMVARKLEVCIIDVRHILEDGGFLDLLEAAENLLKPGGVVPVDDMVVGGEKIKKLEAAIAKITWAGDS